jgi:predicted ATPase/class 3 adenylate cyclase/Tfp pilus assembly protein PilF
MPVFLITDIEGSTKKWEQYPETMKKALQRHDEIINTAVSQHGGVIIKHTGDGVFAVFEKGDPLSCAIEIQKKMDQENWTDVGVLRIRMGLHAGYAEKVGNDYFGPAVNKTARVMAAAWGGQIVLTPDVTNVSALPAKAQLKNLGMHMLKDLGEPQQILQLDHGDLSQHDFPELRSLSAHPHNLPQQSTPFFGREEELDKICELLTDPAKRLISIVGPGGMGKTRLVLQAAAEQIERFSNGVFFVPLAPLTTIPALISAIASATRFSFYSREDEKIQLLNFLREKEILLILDNFEHVMEGTELVGQILAGAPRVKIITTSRELLNLRGEWIVNLSGMPVPESGQQNIETYSLVQLFVYNAQRVQHSYRLTDEDSAYVARICQLVGGLPLGIELAAAWIRCLSVKEILQEIEKNMDFLATSQRDMPERHRSLRAIFDYSWNLLTEQERDTLMRLSIFQRDFTRAAAEKIAGTSLGTLASLVDKSLLRKTEKGRYELLKTIRNYTLERLTEQSEELTRMNSAHCEYYLGSVAQMNKSVYGDITVLQEQAIALDIENIRAAWKWGVDHDKVDLVGDAIPNLFIFYRKQGFHKEGLEAVLYAAEKLIRHQGTQMYGRLLREQGALMINTTNINAATPVLEKSLHIFRALKIPQEIARTLIDLGDAFRYTGRIEEARKCYGESMDFCRELNDTFGTATGLERMAFIYEALGEYLKAIQLASQSLSLWQSMKNEYGIAMALNILGMTTHGAGDYEGAKRYYLESLDVSRRLNNKMGIGRAMNNVANVFALQGDYEQAIKYYEECLMLFRDMGNVRGVAAALGNIGIIETYHANFDKARSVFEEALAIEKSIGYKSGICSGIANLAAIAEKTGDLERARELQEESLKMAREINDVWLVETGLNSMAMISMKQGDLRQAKAYVGEALEMVYKKDHKQLIYDTLMTVARIMQQEGRTADVMELCLQVSSGPVFNIETKKEAQKMIDEVITKGMDKAAFEKAKADATGKSLDVVVGKILNECKKAASNQSA